MLERIITSAARRALLELFVLNPDNSYHLREICRRTGLAPRAVSLEADNLEKAGFLESEREANLRRYRLDKSFPLYPAFREIFRTEAELFQRMKHLLAKLGASSAFIYGSYGKSRETRASDIDLMIIGKVDPKALLLGLRRIEEMSGREINYAIFSEEEFSGKRKTSPFLARILSERKIMLIGDEP